jgi:hypothetical protein
MRSSTCGTIGLQRRPACLQNERGNLIGLQKLCAASSFLQSVFNPPSEESEGGLHAGGEVRQVPTVVERRMEDGELLDNLADVRKRERRRSL